MYSIIKHFFSKGTPLYEELKLYKSILSCAHSKPKLVEKVIAESKSRYDKLDKAKIFSEQSKLIATLNRQHGREFYDCFVPNYKDLATISAIFNDSVSVKTKVLLEENLIEALVAASPPREEHEMIGSKVLMNSFITKFNDKYNHLHEEQKCLLNAFILSLSDDGLSMRAFLNEELGRLKTIVLDSKNLEEVKGDSSMIKGTNEVLMLFEEFKKKPLDTPMVEQILKIQNLAREIQE